MVSAPYAKSTRFPFLPGLLLLALAACAPVGPTYHLPVTAAVARPSAQWDFLGAGAASATTPDQPLPADWWRLYDDPRLDALIARALAANTDLRVADANLRRAMALLGESEARRQVQGGLSAQTGWTQRSAEQVLSHTQPAEKGTYDMDASVSYDLDLFGGLRRGIEAAHADSEAARAARDLARVNIVAQTARAYADICNLGYEADVLTRLIAAQQEVADLTRKSAAHGRAAPLDEDRHQVLVDTARAKMPGLLAGQKAALFRLAALLGQTPAEADMSLLQCHAPLVLRAPMPVGDGRALLARRPDIRLTERQLAADTARIGVATAALYPDISLGASLGSTGLTDDLLSPLTNRFSIGPSIHWTLNRNAARARIAATRAGADADLARFDGAVLAALRDVESALATYAGDLDREAALRAASADATRAAGRLDRLRRGGRVGGIVAVEAERDAIAAQEALAANAADLSHDQIALFLALGGGWQG
ncbi:MAG: efflux transporter outer membrane subunit [Sphingomonadales bacterium]|nr:efflux transporter outer membrane subunit [Sphingomonadales bacterium]MDE2169771.1 efflux transporter outer membrane subunit [Sphingomonadales bacterium]